MNRKQRWIVLISLMVGALFALGISLADPYPTASLSKPEISLVTESPAAGKDVTLRCQIDEATESIIVCIYKRTEGSSVYLGDNTHPLQYRTLQVQRNGGEATITIDGYVVDAGYYRVELCCNAADYGISSATYTFTVTGERDAGPVVSTPSGTAYVNETIPFTVTQGNATALRVLLYTEYRPVPEDGMHTFYDEEIYPVDGVFTWTEKWGSEGTVFVTAMALVNGTWTKWAEPV